VAGVHLRSIADVLGRSRGGIYTKGRRLGLYRRARPDLHYLSIQDAAAITFPWKDAFRSEGSVDDGDELDRSRRSLIAAPTPDSPGEQKRCVDMAMPTAPRKRKRWSGPEINLRLSILAFANLRPAFIAKCLAEEFGEIFTECAIINRISRLQIIRDRYHLLDECDLDQVEEMAAINMKKLGAKKAQCAGLKRLYWRYPGGKGLYTSCNEFAYRDRFASARSNLQAAAVYS
jgi:hypothetical protein